MNDNKYRTNMDPTNPSFIPSPYRCCTCTREDCPVWIGSNKKQAQSGKQNHDHHIISLSEIAGFACHSSLQNLPSIESLKNEIQLINTGFKKCSFGDECDDCGAFSRDIYCRLDWQTNEADAYRCPACALKQVEKEKKDSRRCEFEATQEAYQQLKYEQALETLRKILAHVTQERKDLEKRPSQGDNEKAYSKMENWLGDEIKKAITNNSNLNHLVMDIQTIAELPDIIRTPFNQDQLASLEGYQNCKEMHPFTCSNCGKPLGVRSTGFHCFNPACGKWFQPWAYRFMTDGSWKNALNVDPIGDTILINAMEVSGIPKSNFPKIKATLAKWKKVAPK